MTRRRELARQEASLRDIRDILATMKNLSLIELRKLSLFLASQQAVSRAIEDIAAEFLTFHPEFRRWPPPDARIVVLLGSERGFCGDFNESLVAVLVAQPPQAPATRILTLGQRVGNLLENDARTIARLPGATAVEEVAAALDTLMEQLLAVQAPHTTLELHVLHHAEDTARPAVTPLLPPFETVSAMPAGGSAPRLYLPAAGFFRDLVRQHLFVSLHALLYTSLSVEHTRRVRHLEGAIRRVDERLDALVRRGQALRQEEITEEIEVILLSADGVCPAPRTPAPGLLPKETEQRFIRQIRR